MSSRGGARDGAGRPKGEETTMVRVPNGCLEAVRSLISSYKNQSEPLSFGSRWQPLSTPPEPDRRIDLWCVQDGSGSCCYNISSDHFLNDTRRKAHWVLKSTAWRYSELVVAPDF
ncbi:hypothetical protein [Aeromonas sobria]|uniref:hypothetical protein n=1 Tax=Aeromonas sobria TaxID=646 RepID=UPI0012FED2DD|nr:hypothetical protein [Aeromonas sobria]